MASPSAVSHPGSVGVINKKLKPTWAASSEYPIRWFAEAGRRHAALLGATAAAAAGNGGHTTASMQWSRRGRTAAAVKSYALTGTCRPIIRIDLDPTRRLRRQSDPGRVDNNRRGPKDTRPGSAAAEPRGRRGGDGRSRTPELFQRLCDALVDSFELRRMTLWLRSTAGAIGGNSPSVFF